MKKNPIIKLPVWLAVLIVILILYGGWRVAHSIHENKAPDNTARIESDEQASPEVAVSVIQNGSLSSGVWVTGEIRALEKVEIISKISGRLESLRLPDGTVIEEGVEVKKDEVIAVIEHEQLSAAVRAAKAVLNVAKAAYAVAEVNTSDAQREKNRWIELRKGGSGTQQQLDKAVTAYERAKAQLKQAEAQIEQSEAALVQAEVNLADATIKAPFSGIVARKYVDEGAFVGPGAPLFRLADISNVEIAGNIAGRYFPEIQTGATKAIVEVDAYPGKFFEGLVKRVRPELDSVTRTLAVTIEVPNPDRALAPGMYAKMKILLEERQNVPVVPDAALVNDKDKTLVYVVEKGEIDIREVETGLVDGALCEVVAGLQPGDAVVLRGFSLLEEGMSVTPVETEEIQ